MEDQFIKQAIAHGMELNSALGLYNILRDPKGFLSLWTNNGQ